MVQEGKDHLLAKQQESLPKKDTVQYTQLT
ncbi:MAG: hypothetical protein ACI8RD_011847 [Bacillariaceae sp.]|jgi:hypothetical protein